MFKITRDAIYLFVIFWLLLIMTVEFHWFVGHYEYLTSILQLMYKSKSGQNIHTAYIIVNRISYIHG